MKNLRIRTGDLLEIDNRIYEVKRVDINRNIFCYYGDTIKRVLILDIQKLYRRNKTGYELIYEEVV